LGSGGGPGYDHRLVCLAMSSASFGHAWPVWRCPLLGAKQKSQSWATTSVFDPKQTLAIGKLVEIHGPVWIEGI
jgi:hypothetical protein